MRLEGPDDTSETSIASRTSDPPAERGAPAAGERPMLVIGRDEIPTLRTVVIDRVEHDLGILKDFRRHPAIAEFLPQSARLAISWVRLVPGQTLERHVHPIASMIVVAEGEGRTLGDLEADFGPGDIVIIPGGSLHGFVGAGASGFWALSIQFEERGLYERPHDPLVAFDGDGHADDRRAQGLQELLRRNAGFCESYRDNAMFALVADHRLDDLRVRQRYLACVQTWSNWFQRAMFLRSAVTRDDRFSGLFRAHLDEEYGHDRLLAGERGSDEILWDPILEGVWRWFATSMLMLDDAAKAVLVHLVLEAASSTFMATAQPILDSYGQLTYFDLHNEADDEHVAMAERALDGLSPDVYERLFAIQDQGWQMLNALCQRMAELSVPVDDDR